MNNAAHDPYDFESLETPLDDIPTKAANSQYAKTEQYPCEACAGTGFYNGVRVHQEKEHCFACRGKGYFLTSKADRQKARAQRQNRVAVKQADNIAQVKSDHPGLVDFLIGASEWSEFAKSVLEGISKYGSISDKQLSAVSSMKAKCDARQAEKNAQKAEEKKPLDLDLSKLFELFNNATGSGLKKPRLNIHNLAVSKAPEHGNNAGCLYLKVGGEYAGKITPDFQLRVLREFNDQRDSITGVLSGLTDNPLEYAKEYGRQTGICCCCNRELTDPESIQAGIGPICQGKWGL